MQSVFDLLNNGKYSKLVCGAGNEDAETVKKLVFVFAKAGWKIFDLSANKEVLLAAKEGASLAKASDINYCISIGIKGDPHISKAQVNNSKCAVCGNCSRICPNQAIYPPNLIDKKKCIGCGKCAQKCPSGAISMIENSLNLKNVLPDLIKNGANIIEIHITGNDHDDLTKKWDLINSCNPVLASICTDRQFFGNKEVINRLREMLSQREDFTTVIQADGIPMSGGHDDYKSTLQAVAMAEIIQNANLPAYLTLSGGTNSKTAELCKLCGIKFNGIAIGSMARKIVNCYISMPDFMDNKSAQQNAVNTARNLLLANFPE